MAENPEFFQDSCNQITIPVARDHGRHIKFASVKIGEHQELPMPHRHDKRRFCPKPSDQVGRLLNRAGGGLDGFD